MYLLKKLSLIAASSLAMIASVSNASGLPVIDAAHIATTQVSHMEQIAKWVIQLQDMKTQIEKMQGVWSTLKDGRGMGSILNQDLVHQYLPQDYWDVAKKIADGSGDWEGISGRVRDVVQQNQYRSCAQLNPDPGLRNQCEKRWRELAMSQEVGDMGYKKAAQNIRNLQVFVGSINNSSDQKTISEIQARIQLENVRLQNERIKLDTIAKMEEATLQMRTQKVNDGFNAGLATFSRPSF